MGKELGWRVERAWCKETVRRVLISEGDNGGALAECDGVEGTGVPLLSVRDMFLMPSEVWSVESGVARDCEGPD
jgi:hypothetical protein